MGGDLKFIRSAWRQRILPSSASCRRRSSRTDDSQCLLPPGSWHRRPSLARRGARQISTSTISSLVLGSQRRPPITPRRTTRAPLLTRLHVVAPSGDALSLLAYTLVCCDSHQTSVCFCDPYTLIQYNHMLSRSTIHLPGKQGWKPVAVSFLNSVIHQLLKLFLLSSCQPPREVARNGLLQRDTPNRI